jgi:osmotically-inducible protein OsmY
MTKSFPFQFSFWRQTIEKMCGPVRKINCNETAVRCSYVKLERYIRSIKMKTDAQIQADVIQELKWDPRVTHEHVGVAVTDGIVTLTGTIPSYIEKVAAEKAVQRVAGVKAVVERIEVKIPGSLRRDDQDLAKTIIEQFKWNSQVPDELVKASVENGWVELTGQVEWGFQRGATEKAIRGLMGVKGITNNITIKQRIVQPSVIKGNIEEALKRAAERESNHIGVEVRGTSVILSGSVRSFAELRDVRAAAWSAAGVTSVDDDELNVAA